MSTFGAGSTGTYIAAGVVAAGVAVGGYVYVSSKNAPPAPVNETPVVVDTPTAVEPVVAPPAAAPQTPAAVTPAPDVTEPDVTVAEPAAEVAEPAAIVPPSFDVVRVDADGNAVIAGLAAPNSKVFVYLGQVEIAQSDADPSGNFVALTTVAPSDDPQVVSLVMRADGVDTPSDATVIIAPRPAVVAATDEPAPVETPAKAAVEAIGVELTGTAQIAGNYPVEEASETATPENNTRVVADAEPTEPTPVVEPPVVATEPVPAPAPDVAPTVLIADNDGVRILQGTENVAPSEITIDAISYGENGDAVLTGRGDGDAVVRVYLNNSITGETAIATTGDWTLPLANVAAGIYTLRVDQVDDTGAVTSRFETPFKREDPVVIAAASTPEVASIKTPVVKAEAPRVEEVEPVATPTPVAVTEVASPEAPAPAVTAITVQPGFTLWKIAKDAYGQGDLYVQVFDANKDAIVNPDLIYPGQVFAVPTVSAN